MCFFTSLLEVVPDASLTASRGCCRPQLLRGFFRLPVVYLVGLTFDPFLDDCIEFSKRLQGELRGWRCNSQCITFELCACSTADTVPGSRQRSASASACVC